MPWVLKLIMFVCIVPTVIIIYAIGFPKEPGKKKMIFGVRDNPKFHEGDAARKVSEIVSSCRRSALIITIAVCLLSVILLFLPTTGMTMLAWTLLAFVLFIIAVPFGKGNTELKNLKKELGITKEDIGKSISIEDSLALYEEGVALVRLCNARLESVERKISLLRMTPDGEITTEPFGERGE